MPLPPVSEKKFTEGFGPGGATTGKLRIIVTGAGGFIASHLSKRLKAEGHFVRGRNSENTLIKEKLGWEPDTPLAEGLKITYDWIKSKVDEAGGDAARFSSSKVCGVQAPTAMGELRAADGKETTL